LWKVGATPFEISRQRLTSQESWAALDQVDVSKSCRVMKMLDLRTFELKSDVHEVFDQVWKQLIQVDIGAGTVAICDVINGKTVSFFLHISVVD
jgi:centromere/kinetochore protein ZW10